jgi:hypothetical protein
LASYCGELSLENNYHLGGCGVKQESKKKDREDDSLKSVMVYVTPARLLLLYE